jgi:hypothetical protein
METTGSIALQIEDTIDDLVADLYGLTAAERRIVGIREHRE